MNYSTFFPEKHQTYTESIAWADSVSSSVAFVLPKTEFSDGSHQQGKYHREDNCRSAFNINPASASKIDPHEKK
jgi:hypothetical protein